MFLRGCCVRIPVSEHGRAQRPMPGRKVRRVRRMQATSDRKNPKRDSKYAKKTTAANRISCGQLRQQQGRMTLHRQSGAEGTYTPTAPRRRTTKAGKRLPLCAVFRKCIFIDHRRELQIRRESHAEVIGALGNSCFGGPFSFCARRVTFMAHIMRRSPFIQGEHRPKSVLPRTRPELPQQRRFRFLRS